MIGPKENSASDNVLDGTALSTEAANIASDNAFDETALSTEAVKGHWLDESDIPTHGRTQFCVCA